MLTLPVLTFIDILQFSVRLSTIALKQTSQE